MHEPVPEVMEDSRWEYMVVNSDWRQGSEAGTEDTWRCVRAIWNGEEVVWAGDRRRVESGVKVRGFLITTLWRRNQ